jgi:hypothetical protein
MERGMAIRKRTRKKKPKMKKMRMNKLKGLVRVTSPFYMIIKQ